MIPPQFDYISPQTLPEALTLLGNNPDAKVLAGGHSLIPMLKFRLATPTLLVDIGRLAGLSYIREEDGWLKIGALTVESAIDKSSLIHAKYPLLSDAARMIADPIVRNKATVGGNLAHADPANDHPAVMLAYGAEIVVTGVAGPKTIPITEFFVGPFTPAINHAELLTEIRIPAHKPGDGGSYIKIERKVGDYATAGVAVQLHVTADGTCDKIGLALTNLGLTPIHCTAAMAALTGTKLTDADVKHAVALAADVAEPQDDYRGTEEYKRSLVRTITTRAIKAALVRAKA